MMQLILMLLGLAFSNENTTSNNSNQNPITVQNAGGTTPGTGLETDPGDTSGGSGQKPPFVNP